MKKMAVLLAAAAPIGPSVVPTTLGGGPNDLVCLIKDVTNWTFTIFLVVAVFFILLAAYYYLLAQGSGEEVAKTHKMLIWSAVAIAVAILSRGFIVVVQKVVGVQAQEACGASPATGTSTPTTPPVADTSAVPAGPKFTQLGVIMDAAGKRATSADSSIITLSVEECAGSWIPAFKVSATPQLQGGCADLCTTHEEKTGNYDPYLVQGQSVQMEQCADGTKPHFIVAGVRYPNN